ncbi:MAG: hypothetical protein ACXWGY_02710 [Chthoniobacterales bacterium]
MKPTFSTTEIGRRDSIESALRPSSPKTDYHFRASSFDFSGRCKGEGHPSFRRISEEYFKNEARQHFASEAAVFALIVLIISVPLFEVARTVVAWVL